MPRKTDNEIVIRDCPTHGPSQKCQVYTRNNGDPSFYFRCCELARRAARRAKGFTPPSKALSKRLDRVEASLTQLLAAAERLQRVAGVPEDIINPQPTQED